MNTALQKKECMCKLDLKDAYLRSPFFSIRPKEKEVLLEKISIPVSITVLWPYTSLICFKTTLENPHGSLKKDRDTHNNLFGRYVD